ncbi:MAG: phosphonate metabolism protein/1,5-bisphosphokinase (PRPP-forming) PhnN [Candidatus Devosia euplotis]|nr:phosphonate metabolism protein/1,5-bisphosphokinase (PRPP-forming) PhnN [Candidatus Devosia euplotis]
MIGGARQALGNGARFSFVQRVVTRLEDSEFDEPRGMVPADFAQAEAMERFCLCWDAHNLRYDLPISVEIDLALGKVVVTNVSRHVVGEACLKFPACAVVLITAEISRRAERLIRRGREGRDQIAARLARESEPVPNGINPIIIDNSGLMVIGVTAFVMALRTISAQE